MKIFGKIVSVIVAILAILENVIGFLLIPAILVWIGVSNQLPWRYYVISIGVYLLLFAFLVITMHFVRKRLDKKYTAFPERLVEKITHLFHSDHTES